MDERALTTRSPAQVARTTFIASVVALGVVVVAVALWKIRLILGLFLFGMVIASAMRPGVTALHRRGVPRALGVAVHYAAVGVVVGVLLWLVVPQAVTEVQKAIAEFPNAKTEVAQEAVRSEGLKQDLLKGLERRLSELPTGSELVGPAVELTKTAVELIVGIFFLFASAAYWLFERDRVERVVLSALPASRRATVRDTWRVIDLKLGAFVRGQLLVILLVGSVLSFAFWAIGLPYWILIGVSAGIVEIVPVIGPLIAGVLAVGVGLTVSWQLGVTAGVIVLAVRLAEDYLLLPRVLGRVVRLSPLIILISVSAAGVLFGAFGVLLAIPLAVVAATTVEVVLFGRDPKDSSPQASGSPRNETV
jgi:predicted PurR-regulated permease PerM